MADPSRRRHFFFRELTLTAGVCALVVQIPPATGTVAADRDARTFRAVARPATAARSGSTLRIAETYGRLPLSFEANRGQTAAPVKFLARGSGYSLFLTSTETVLALQKLERDEPADKLKEASPVGGVIRMRLLGGRPDAPVAGRNELPGRVNYFRGNDTKQWRTNIPTYAKVAYEDVYPGIDVVYYGNQQQLEYDFVVSPGADPHAIRLGFDGADRLDVDAQGDLVLQMANGTVRQRKPFVYQEIDGVRREVTGGYLVAEAAVTFDLGRYDQTRPLVIDPVLVYSTFLGGAAMDQGLGIAVDAAGSAHVTGQTMSMNYPTTPGLDQILSGTDAVVTKLDPTGTALLYSTYLGGSLTDVGRSIAVDVAGNAYVTGQTFSSGAMPGSMPFPTTAGAFDTTFNGLNDAFVTKLNAQGELVYSTYLGGGGPDNGNGIAVDTIGAAYVTGQASLAPPPRPPMPPPPSFPTTPGVYDAEIGGFNDAFVAKLNPLGSMLAYSTFLGGSGIDIGFGVAVDGEGAAYVTGQTSSANFPTTPSAFATTFNGGLADAFVTKLNSAGSALDYSTYLGGGGSEAGRSIVVDADENAYVTGQTASNNFPAPDGAFDTSANGMDDAYATKLNADGTALLYSTYLGGNASDQGNSIGVDTAGNAYVTGQTASMNFPIQAGAFDATFNGGMDAFVTMLDGAGRTLAYSTYLGGSGSDVAFGIGVDTAGNAYVTGQTFSGTTIPSNTAFPTTAGAYDESFNGLSDAFVTQFGPLAADVLITKEDSPDPVVTGTDLTYTLAVTNNGPDPATNVTVTDMLPAETKFKSCSATDGGVCGGADNNRTVKFAKLDPGMTQMVTLVATVACSVADGLPIYNTASVSASMDANTTNNVDMVTMTASNPAPTIEVASVDKPTLWPPNHKMVDVTVGYGVTDNCEPPVNACTLSVSSNEPQDGLGDGDTGPDWEIVDATHVRLRAERSGGGNGRLYTITITCTDSGGTSSTQTVTVSVPKSQGKN